ncbi:MAG TPA: VOC family protein [Dokdonella sp.]|uniref:VOC family protein n=1 Tax=Dokdonella sp. TaxID=2291710 RepID=UPI002D7FA204|nr:VOC family protein [Dokdonella sp.]HET9034135.1 VOC family protein [Dokdonella sp.]
MPNPFHLAIPVHDLAAARAFYGGVLACPEGRSSAQWVDFNLYGHQLVCHVVEGTRATSSAGSNAVDGHAVPVPHFGVVLDRPEWNSLAERLRAVATSFVIEPHLRFVGQPGEQATMFLLDPSGNALEFKSFADIEGQLFAT